jgi:hypothetical protein
MSVAGPRLPATTNKRPWRLESPGTGHPDAMAVRPPTGPQGAGTRLQTAMVFESTEEGQKVPESTGRRRGTYTRETDTWGYHPYCSKHITLLLCYFSTHILRQRLASKTRG